MLDFGFEYTPFGVTPDSRMVFRHSQFEDAYAALDEGLRAGKGFIVISGDVGAGKTTLLRSYLAAEHPELRTAVILNTGLDPDGLLRAVAEDLEIALAAEAGRKAIIDLLRDNLLETFAAGRQTAVFVDEAQNLSPESLELLRMLSNLETENEKLIQIVLFGQDPLREILARPDMLQLRSRIAVHRHLRPLDRAETGEYVAHRIAAAGAALPVAFSAPAIKVLHRASGGSPRLINILADGALQAAAEEDLAAVEARHVKAAARAFADLEPEARPAFASARRNLATVVAWALLLAAIVLLGQRILRRPEPATLALEPPATATAAATQPHAGAAVLAFFRAYGLAPAHTSSQFEALRPEIVARQLDRRWVELPAQAELIAAIGLPTLARLRGLAGEEPVVLRGTADRSRLHVIRATSEEEIEPALLALDESFAPVILLPLALPERLLRPGDAGDEVRRLQDALFRAGFFRGVVNGFYGPTTVAAVRDFQAAERLPVDGLVGPWTLGALARRNDWSSP